MKYSSKNAAADLARCVPNTGLIRELQSAGPVALISAPETWEHMPKFPTTAKAIGVRLYHSEPCAHGHAPIRAVTSKGSACATCKKKGKLAAEQRRMDTDPEYRKARAVAAREDRTRNLERRRDQERDWRSRNRAKCKAKKMRGRDALRHATPDWLTETHWDEMNAFYVERDRQSCETGEPHHVDHIIPLRGENVCGLHVPWNLQVITAAENMSKGARFYDI